MPRAMPTPSPFSTGFVYRGCFSASCEALDHRDRRQGLAIRSGIAFAPGIFEAERDRIHLELERQLVQRGLQREVSLGRARSAVRLNRRLVGRDLVTGDLEVGACVGRGQEHAGDPTVPAGGRAVVVVKVRAQRDQRAVLLRAQLDVEAGRRRGARHCEDLLAGEVEAQRAAGSPREEHEKRLEEGDLAAEPTAHGHRHDAHLVGRNAEHLGDLVAKRERTLRRRPDGHSAVGLGPHHRDVWLHGRVVDAGEAVGGLDHGVRRLERRAGVAALEVDDTADVRRAFRCRAVGLGVRARAVHRCVGSVGLLLRVEHPDRALAHRVLGVDGYLQRLVVDVDEGGGVGRCRLAFGDDRDDRLADVKDAADRERFLGTGRRRR